MATEPTANQLKSLCVRYHMLSILYVSIGRIMERKPNRLAQVWQTHPNFRRPPMPCQLYANVRNEGIDRSMGRLDLHFFVNPASQVDTFNLLNDEVERVGIEIAPAFRYFDRNTQEFDAAGYAQIPLESPTVNNVEELSNKLDYIIKAC